MGRSSAEAQMRCRSCAGNGPAARMRRLLPARTREHLVQTRFASLRGVPVDNAAFGRLIDRGNKSTHVVRIGLGRTTCALLHAAQPRDRAAIAKCSAHILASAFGGGLGVGHDLEKLWARRLVEPRWIVKMPNGLTRPETDPQRRGYDSAKQLRPRNVLRDDRTLTRSI